MNSSCRSSLARYSPHVLALRAVLDVLAACTLPRGLLAAVTNRPATAVTSLDIWPHR